MLPAAYVTERVRACRDDGLVYLAVHNHGGRGSVAFSDVDLATHERGFPALLDICGGRPVGALVFADGAVAGDIWTPQGRYPLQETIIVGPTRRRLTPAPERQAGPASGRFDRQVRLFGDAGQAVLGCARVAIIGLGGVGILLAEYLGRLGVGEFVLIDPDRLQPSNLPRMVHASDLDAMVWLCGETRPKWLKNLGYGLATPKVRLAQRIIRRANPRAVTRAFLTEMEDAAALVAVKGCDYIFLAADSHRARLVFNAVAHQHLIPGVQLGSRIRSDRESGDVQHVHTALRWVLPDSGCLICNQAINAARLQEESVSAAMRRAQKYADDPDVVAPSVITLNAVAASQAANDFLFYMTGLALPGARTGYVRTHPLERRIEMVHPRKGADCPDCSVEPISRLARGDGARLPLVE
jgi:hypothetical protein